MVVVFNNKYMVNIRYEDLEQSPGGRNIGGVRYVSGYGEEIRRWVWKQVQYEGGGYGRVVLISR